MPRGVIDAARDAVGASHGHGPGLADSTRAYSVCRVSAFVGHASSGPLNRESAEFLIASSRVEFHIGGNRNPIMKYIVIDCGVKKSKKQIRCMTNPRCV